ncbi:MAG TPA: hydroxymethylglutaryl-CoA reductase, degradative [Polyangiaceae bacterium]|jgi:hydroxymethylglutaryl-CoA reductase|nr:hydroxymethylglutaryl-CoA reductase, degradative [Polyangiaceae bacterium]
MSEGSRIPGFYKLSLAARRLVVSERAGVELGELTHALEQGGLDSATADKVVENVLGIYGLPFGVALNVRVNGVDRLVPMVVEEPSVIAAASNAARMVRHSGGFRAEVVESLMIGQVQVTDVAEPSLAVARLEGAAARLLELATKAVPNLIARGGGPRAIDVRDLGQRCIVLHVLVDCRDAMGANMVNTIAEAIGPLTAELAGGTLGLRILSNLCDRRRVHATCRVHARELVRAPRSESVPEYPPGSERAAPLDGSEVVDAIVAASRFAELDPYRATTHNKGIMNGIDAVVLATGNDFRAVEAGAHAYAARSGRYAPLAVWRRDGEDLVGELELPLALGIVGGTLRVHPTARLALKLLALESADELAMVAASVGLASNLSALRALATEGIQRGHMSLHARSVATAAGALGDEVELVAARIATSGLITVEAALRALAEVRATPPIPR